MDSTKDIIRFFKRLLKISNKIEDDYTNLQKIDSYALGLIIGSRYVGVCGCSEDNKRYKQFESYIGSEYDGLEFANCGNGFCIHIINVVPILKELITFDYNFKYGYYYNCDEKNIKLSDFKQDDFKNMLKDLQKFNK